MRSRCLDIVRCTCWYTNPLHRSQLPVSVRRSTRLYSSVVGTRKWSTPLAKQLGEAIAVTGPISIASYMRQCLTSKDGGYYTSSPDPFGRSGDFVTSPEITQIFGELIGLWFVSEWMLQGRRKNGVVLMEVGPGRGTLMRDMLTAIERFPSMSKSISHICLVEASPTLRNLQKELLCGDAKLDRRGLGLESRSKILDAKVVWYEDIRHVPKEASTSPFIVAHEFFDALPIHAFQSVVLNKSNRSTGPQNEILRTSSEPQWRELLVTSKPPPSVLGRPNSDQFETSDFELSLSKASTPHSLYLTKLSERYSKILPKAGSTIEISPESQIYISDFATRIGGSSLTQEVSNSQHQPPSSSAANETLPEDSSSKLDLETYAAKSEPSGAALIIDYGPSSNVPVNSLKGVRAHRRVSPFSNPGAVDVSADVDFPALVEAALKASEGIEVHGPVEQGAWLTAMGIQERAALLSRTEASQRSVKQAVDRLIDRSVGMGAVYKVLAIVPERNGRRPVGFGGEMHH